MGFIWKMTLPHDFRSGAKKSMEPKIPTWSRSTRRLERGKVVGTLLASAWSGIDSPFTQTLAVEGLGADQNGNISVAQNATIEQRDAARMAMLSVIGQSEGQLIISADGEMPEVDIPVVVILLG